MGFNAETNLYGVIGCPVKHSMSPKLFNQIFKQYDFNAVYLAFENSDLKKLITCMKVLDIKGYSITIPFKEAALEYVDEIDSLSQHLGCINTIENQDGRLKGYNFDGQGAILGLEEFYSAQAQELGESDYWYDKTILLIGSGGAARGILLTLVSEKKFTGKVILAARNFEKASILIKQALDLKSNLQIDYQPWSQLEIKQKMDVDIIIQTTPIGMYPNFNQSPLLAENIEPHMVVYDIVYNPLETKLLKQAKTRGAKTITGLDMFLGQARLQLETWTPLSFSLKEMHNYYQ